MENKIKINCVIGIDPGANGGIAIFIPGAKVKTVKNPKDVTDLSEFLQYYKDNYNSIVFLEKLSVRPDDVAVGPNDKANMGKLYRIQKMIANYEHLKSIIEVIGIPFALVHPRKWMFYLGLIPYRVKEEKAERKRRYAETAQKWYPDIKVTLWNADAILIMHFARKILVNDINWVRQNVPQRTHNKLF